MRGRSAALRRGRTPLLYDMLKKDLAESNYYRSRENVVGLRSYQTLGRDRLALVKYLVAWYGQDVYLNSTERIKLSLYYALRISYLIPNLLPTVHWFCKRTEKCQPRCGSYSTEIA